MFTKSTYYALVVQIVNGSLIENVPYVIYPTKLDFILKWVENGSVTLG